MTNTFAGTAGALPISATLGHATIGEADVRPVTKDGAHTAHVISNDGVRRSGEELVQHMEAQAIAAGAKVCGEPLIVVRRVQTNINVLLLTYMCTTPS